MTNKGRYNMFEMFPFLNNIFNDQNNINNQDNNRNNNRVDKESNRRDKENNRNRKESKRNSNSKNRENENYSNQKYNNSNYNNWNSNNVNYNNQGYGGNNYNSRNYIGNGYNNRNNNFNSSQDILSMLAGGFNSIFNQVFTTVIQNQDIITDIVDSVLNSEVINDIVNAMEEDIDLNLIEYDDRYLIEGKLIGVNKKDIDIDYENNYVKIKVKKDLTFTNGANTMIHVFKDTPDLEKTYHVSNVDVDKIKAVYKDNILKVYLKKQAIEKKEATIIDVDYSTVD